MEALKTSEKLALEHVTAKMKIAADGVLIDRLESGEAFKGVGEDPIGMNTLAASYIACLRTSLNRKMEGIYLGDGWIAKFSEATPQLAEKEFLAIGYTDCPTTRSAYSVGFERVVAAEHDKSTRNIIQKNYAPSAIEHMAVRPYLTVVRRGD
jgi:hypothetical protein